MRSVPILTCLRLSDVQSQRRPQRPQGPRSLWPSAVGPSQHFWLRDLSETRPCQKQVRDVRGLDGVVWAALQNCLCARRDETTFTQCSGGQRESGHAWSHATAVMLPTRALSHEHCRTCTVACAQLVDHTRQVDVISYLCPPIVSATIVSQTSHLCWARSSRLSLILAWGHVNAC
jgi:hypothetical protein